METLLAVAKVLVTIDVLAVAIVGMILLLAVPIFGLACCITRWQRRARLITPYATNAL